MLARHLRLQKACGGRCAGLARLSYSGSVRKGQPFAQSQSQSQSPSPSQSQSVDQPLRPHFLQDGGGDFFDRLVR